MKYRTYVYVIWSLQCFGSVDKAGIYCLFGVDLSSMSGQKSFVVNTLYVDDLEHPTISSFLRNPASNDVKLQFSRSAGDESNLLGSVSVSLKHIPYDNINYRSC